MSPHSIIYKMAESPFPPSFQGSGVAYAISLFALLLISMIGAGTVSLAARNLMVFGISKYDRIIHIAFLLAAVGATPRCAADAIYMMAWGEVSAPTLEDLMFGKRIIDSLVMYPVVTWMTLYGLKISKLDKGRHRVARYGIMVSLVALLAAIFAFSKV